MVRFNNAPTNDFELDVGEKTSLRILNSQILSKPEFHFMNSSLYHNVTLLVWDPCKYNATLDEVFDYYNLQSSTVAKFRSQRQVGPQSGFLFRRYVFLEKTLTSRRRPAPDGPSGSVGLVGLPEPPQPPAHSGESPIVWFYRYMNSLDSSHCNPLVA